VRRQISAIDCSLRLRVGTFFAPALASTALLLAAGVAVNYRTIYCQIQAAAVVLVAAAAVHVRERERKRRTETGVKEQRIVYCLQCGRTSETALAFGALVALTRGESSIYEKLHVPLFNASLMLGVWAAWVAYGALFHEGAHEAAVNAALEVSFGFSDTLPALVHAARLVALFAAAVVSLFARRAFALPHLGVLFLAALLPPAGATAQALSLGELTSRTALFAALFLVADAFELNARYCAWLRSPHSERNVVIAAVHCALKGDKPLPRPAPAPAPEGSVSLDILSEAAAAAGADVGGRSYSLHNSAAHLVTALRSAWVLLVSCEGASLALVLLVLMLALMLRERLVVRAQVTAKKLDFIRFDGGAVRALPIANSECHRASSSSTTPPPPLATNVSTSSTPVASQFIDTLGVRPPALKPVTVHLSPATRRSPPVVAVPPPPPPPSNATAPTAVATTTTTTTKLSRPPSLGRPPMSPVATPVVNMLTYPAPVQKPVVVRNVTSAPPPPPPPLMSMPSNAPGLSPDLRSLMLLYSKPP